MDLIVCLKNQKAHSRRFCHERDITSDTEDGNETLEGDHIRTEIVYFLNCFLWPKINPKKKNIDLIIFLEEKSSFEKILS